MEKTNILDNSSPNKRPLKKRSITLYLGVLCLHLLAIWLLGLTPVAITKVALLPVLWALCKWSRRSLPLGWTIAILCSWIGDILLLPQLGGGTFLLAGMGAFLLAQLSYCRLLWQRGARLSIVQVLGIITLMALLQRELAATTADLPLRIGIGVYGTFLLAMFSLSLKQAFSSAIKWGAALFVLSDGLIAARMFLMPDFQPTLMSIAVMLTYGLAQLGLAWILITPEIDEKLRIQETQ